MLVGDLVYNDDFDVNTNYAVFDYSDNTEKTWYDKDPVFDTRKDGRHKPPAAILDMKIKYITTDGDCIIIEGEKRN